MTTSWPGCKTIFRAAKIARICRFNLFRTTAPFSPFLVRNPTRNGGVCLAQTPTESREPCAQRPRR